MERYASRSNVKRLVVNLYLDKSNEMLTAISMFPSVRYGLQHLVNLVELRNRTQSVAALRLVQVLEITRGSEATRLKDRLYGIWGLVSIAV